MDKAPDWAFFADNPERCYYARLATVGEIEAYDLRANELPPCRETAQARLAAARAANVVRGARAARRHGRSGLHVGLARGRGHTGGRECGKGEAVIDDRREGLRKLGYQNPRLLPSLKLAIEQRGQRMGLLFGQGTSWAKNARGAPRPKYHSREAFYIKGLQAWLTWR
jgi:hypothetical protein